MPNVWDILERLPDGPVAKPVGVGMNREGEGTSHGGQGGSTIFGRVGDSQARGRSIRIVQPRLSHRSGQTALLVIDLQEGFVAEGARMWTPENLRILPRVKVLIERCRTLGIPVIFTEHAHDASGRDKGLMWDVPLNRPIKYGALEDRCGGCTHLPRDRAGAGRKGHPEAPLQRLLRYRPAHLLARLRRGHGDHHGLHDQLLLWATARDAFFRDYKVIFGSDVTATDNRELHDAELKTLRRGYARVIPADVILDEIGGS